MEDVVPPPKASRVGRRGKLSAGILSGVRAKLVVVRRDLNVNVGLERVYISEASVKLICLRGHEVSSLL